jgi:hypothetical protein
MSSFAANEPSAEDRDYAVSFRANLGFQHGEQFVLDSFADPTFSDAQWGLPLSPAEAANLADRLRLRQRIQEAIDYAASRADYAGMYLDQPAGGTPIFFFTESVAERRSEIEDRLPGGTEFEVRFAPRSLEQLERLADQIAAHVKEFKRQGIPIVEIGSDPVTNHVIVGLEEATPGAQARLQDAYGDAVVTEVVGTAVFDACVDRSQCRPLKGGIEIVA